MIGTNILCKIYNCTERGERKADYFVWLAFLFSKKIDIKSEKLKLAIVIKKEKDLGIIPDIFGVAINSESVG